jgi:hypothetical protein
MFHQFNDFLLKPRDTGLSEDMGSVTCFHVKSTAGLNFALTYAKRGSHELVPVDQSVQD